MRLRSRYSLLVTHYPLLVVTSYIPTIICPLYKEKSTDNDALCDVASYYIPILYRIKKRTKVKNVRNTRMGLEPMATPAVRGCQVVGISANV